MIDKIIGLFHIILSFIASIYFIWRNNYLDTYYILYFCIINISWVLMKNECIVSYISKKLENNDYKMGETTDLKDYETILGSEISNVFLNYLLTMYIVNLLLIVYTSNIKNPLKISLLGVIFSYTLYILSLKNKTEDIRFYKLLNLLTNSAPLFIILGLNS